MPDKRLSPTQTVLYETLQAAKKHKGELRGFVYQISPLLDAAYAEHPPQHIVTNMKRDLAVAQSRTEWAVAEKNKMEHAFVEMRRTLVQILALCDDVQCEATDTDIGIADIIELVETALNYDPSAR